ncbi:MAG: hypothetical protein ABIO70_33845 [Pseudomonadota bacterium]
MSHFRVRRDGIEFPVAGTEALLRLVHDGALSPKDRVREPDGGAWCAAGDLALLKEAFAARAAAAEARHAQRSRPRPPLPATLPAPMPPVAPPAPEEPPPAPVEPHSFAIPEDLLHPEAEEPPTPTPSPRQPPVPEIPPPSPTGVLSFPNGSPMPNLAARLDPTQARTAVEDPAAFLRQDRTRAPDRGRPAVRPWLLVGIALIVVLLAFLVVAWVEETASMRYARSTSPLPGAGAAPAAASGGATAAAARVGSAPRDASGDALYDQMELALRDRLLQGCMTISKEDDLDTALRLELSRLGVQVQTIHAPIISWGGRHSDVPLAVEIKLWYEGQPDQLDRELGAIGMVVGKYAQNYSLDVRTLEVYVRDEQGAARVVSLDPTAARQLYLRRRTLLEFLTGETG